MTEIETIEEARKRCKREANAFAFVFTLFFVALFVMVLAATLGQWMA